MSETSKILATNETMRLIAANKVEGTYVYDADKNHIGAIYTVMIDKISGQVAYVVMNFGGILGIGEKYRALPWNVLTYDVALDGYVVRLSRESLRAAPAYDAQQSPWHDPAYASEISDYWTPIL
jgi:hypothetical protein